jgi:hypothetical protein
MGCAMKETACWVMRGQLCLTGAGRFTVALWLPAGMPLPSLGLRLPVQMPRLRLPSVKW